MSGDRHSIVWAEKRQPRKRDVKTALTLARNETPMVIAQTGRRP
jgi:hypothetical protein